MARIVVVVRGLGRFDSPRKLGRVVDGMGASPTLRWVAMATECESKISDEPEVGAFRMESLLKGRSSTTYCSREGELPDQ